MKSLTDKQIVEFGQKMYALGCCAGFSPDMLAYSPIIGMIQLRLAERDSAIETFLITGYALDQDEG